MTDISARTMVAEGLRSPGDGAHAGLVVLANEPRAYREVTAEVLGQLRPEVEVVLVEPEDLEEAVSRLLPDMVVCDEAPPAVRDGVPVWLELYPGGDASSTTIIHGHSTTLENAQLSDIIALVDRSTGHEK